MFFRQKMPLGIILVEVLFFLPQEKLDQKKKIASWLDEQTHIFFAEGENLISRAHAPYQASGC
jgi:hypothetical protein